MADADAAVGDEGTGRDVRGAALARAMRVLVTGGAGFIGSHIADLLAADGHEPVVLDPLLPPAHLVTAAVGIWSELIHADIRDRIHRDRVGRRGRGVPPGGHGRPRRRRADPRPTPASDLGTAVLLAAMYGAGVGRLVLARSMVVYGEGRYSCAGTRRRTSGPARARGHRRREIRTACPVCGRDLCPALVPEDAPLDPRNTYAASKLAQEHLAAAWARQTGGSVWSLRYHNVYGARMPSDTPYAGVASMFRSALERGEAPRVFEDGRQRRDFIHVSESPRPTSSR